MKILRSFCIAFSTYSKIPMPQFEWKEEDMRYTLLFFPWVGAVIGLVEIMWVWICWAAGIGVLCTSCGMAAIPLLITGGFHVDGFMDTMDAFHSYQSRERKLEILKDSHIGAFAVIMLVLYYLIYVAGCSEVADMVLRAGEGTEDIFTMEDGHTFGSMSAMVVIGCGFFLSRVLSGISLVFWKSAKKEGSLYVVSEAARKRIVRILLMVAGFLCAGVMFVAAWKEALAACLAAMAVFLYYRCRSYREFGGITGDVAGYFVTVCECAMVLAVAVAERM